MVLVIGTIYLQVTDTPGVQLELELVEMLRLSQPSLPGLRISAR